MNDLKKMRDLFQKLGYILSSSQKRLFGVLFCVGLLAAVLEMLGVAIVIPVLNMMLDMDTLRTKWYIQLLNNLFSLKSDSQTRWAICISVMIVYIGKNLFFSFYSWLSVRYACKIQRELSARVLNAYMKQGYIFFVQNNTGDLLQGITGDVSGVYNIIKMLLTILTKALTIICIVVFIMLQSPNMAFILGILIILCFVFIQMIFKKIMSSNGRKLRDLSKESYQISIEAIQGNKEILAMNKQSFFVNYYEKIVSRRNNVMVRVEVGASLPTYIIETICIIGLLAAVAFQMDAVVNLDELITQLSTIAIGAFRILPALGVISSGVNTIMMYTAQLGTAHSTLERVKALEKEQKEKVASIEENHKFVRDIQIKELSYQYPNSEEKVLNAVNFTIKKGQSVALIGPSGAGKTTMADLLLGLLKPSEGNIFMDDIDIEQLGGDWNRIIGYVPQTMYLIDDTIRRNIAFGEETEDDTKIWEALRIAQMEEFVKKLPRGLDTRVGELGVRFSGGQRQRLSIARALYRNPDILVLDEATAALDNETESEVMNAIEKLQGYKTLIIVAHRLSTVRNCDVIYEVKDKTITEKLKSDIKWN